jgi:hypothetical protein
MRRPVKKPTAAKLRSWRVSILRARTHLLGFVEAADQQSAEKAAVKMFVSTMSSDGG